MSTKTIYPLNEQQDLLKLPASRHVIELLISGFNERMSRIRPTTSFSVSAIMSAARKVELEVDWQSGFFAMTEVKSDPADIFGIQAMVARAFGGSDGTLYEFYTTPTSRLEIEESNHAYAAHLHELLDTAQVNVSRLAKSRRKIDKQLFEESQRSIPHLLEMVAELDEIKPELDLLMVPVEWSVEFMKGYLRFSPSLSGQYLDRTAGDIDFTPLMNALGIYEFSLPVFGLVSCENHPSVKWCLDHEKLDLMREIASDVAQESGNFLVKPGDMFVLLRAIGVDVNQVKDIGIAGRMLNQLEGLNKK